MNVFTAACSKTPIIKLTVKQGNSEEALQLRKVRFYDRFLKREFKFLTTLFDFQADMIAALYKIRRQIELLFKQLRQNFTHDVF
jgi:IS4 transposase